MGVVVCADLPVFLSTIASLCPLRVPEGVDVLVAHYYCATRGLKAITDQETTWRLAAEQQRDSSSGSTPIGGSRGGTAALPALDCDSATLGGDHGHGNGTIPPLHNGSSLTTRTCGLWFDFELILVCRYYLLYTVGQQ